MAHLEFAENNLKKESGGAIRCGKGGRTLVGGSFPVGGLAGSMVQWEGWVVDAKYQKTKQ